MLFGEEKDLLVEQAPVSRVFTYCDDSNQEP